MFPTAAHSRERGEVVVLSTTSAPARKGRRAASGCSKNC